MTERPNQWGIFWAYVRADRGRTQRFWVLLAFILVGFATVAATMILTVMLF